MYDNNTTNSEKAQVRIVDTRLATVLKSDRQAMFLSQLHYWLMRSKHFNDDKVWVYNSYKEWQKQFPFWSSHTIRRIVNALEDLEVIVTGNYNKRPGDQTRWYTINYERIAELSRETLIVWRDRVTDHMAKMDKAHGQNGQTITIRLLQKITLALAPPNAIEDSCKSTDPAFEAKAHGTPVIQGKDDTTPPDATTHPDTTTSIASPPQVFAEDMAGYMTDQYEVRVYELKSYELWFVQMMTMAVGDGRPVELNAKQSASLRDVTERFGGDWQLFAEALCSGSGQGINSTDRMLNYLTTCAKNSGMWRVPIDMVADPPTAVEVMTRR